MKLFHERVTKNDYKTIKNRKETGWIKNLKTSWFFYFFHIFVTVDQQCAHYLPHKDGVTCAAMSLLF